MCGLPRGPVRDTPPSTVILHEESGPVELYGASLTPCSLMTVIITHFPFRIETTDLLASQDRSLTWEQKKTRKTIKAKRNMDLLNGTLEGINATLERKLERRAAWSVRGER